MRGRGTERRPAVAPPAGAWIETKIAVTYERKLNVAPPAGAWIETALTSAADCHPESRPPPQGRGLKQSRWRSLGKAA